MVNWEDMTPEEFSQRISAHISHTAASIERDIEQSVNTLKEEYQERWEQHLQALASANQMQDDALTPREPDYYEQEDDIYDPSPVVATPIQEQKKPQKMPETSSKNVPIEYDTEDNVF